MVFHKGWLAAALLCAALTGCGSDDAEPQGRVTVTADASDSGTAVTDAASASDASVSEDPRCVEARRVFVQDAGDYWRKDVVPQTQPLLIARALSNFSDLFQLGLAEAKKHDCSLAGFEDIMDAYALVDPSSPLYATQRDRVTQALEEFDPTIT